MNNENKPEQAASENKPKKTKLLRVILIGLCVVLLLVAAFSGYKIISTLSAYKQAEKTYEEISTQVVTVISSPTPVPVEEKKPDAEVEVSPLQVDFEALRAQSKDAVAYIYSPDTKINYPVAYTDNNFYYIDHLLNGEDNANGTIFIDCRNASDFSDKNTCLYGHNMNDGSMFANLREYREPDYYPEHPVIYLSTPEFNYRLDLIAGCIVEPTSYAYAREFESDEQFMGHVEMLKENSTFESDVEVTAEDKIVTLSTCTYEIDDGRYVVVGKLVKIH